MAELQDIVDAALGVADVESAAIFVPSRDGEAGLALVAAAGIEGPALDGLVAAVQNPMHPVARALTESGSTFDVRPMNPGGPALRGHLPLGGAGVLAVAYNDPLDAAARESLVELAEAATEELRAIPR